MAADGPGSVITVSGAARGPHGSPGPPPTEPRVDTCTAHVTRRGYVQISTSCADMCSSRAPMTRCCNGCAGRQLYLRLASL